AIADAAPDGYTLGIATISTHVVNPIVHRDLRYDPLADFSFVSEIASVPNVVAVHPSVPARTLAELIAYARQHPGKLHFGTPGVGSLGHLIGETFKYSANVDMTHVPYRGAGPALHDAAASTPVGNSPEAFRKVVADALANTRKVVREANLKFE